MRNLCIILLLLSCSKGIIEKKKWDVKKDDTSLQYQIWVDGCMMTSEVIFYTKYNKRFSMERIMFIHGLCGDMAEKRIKGASFKQIINE